MATGQGIVCATNNDTAFLRFFAGRGGIGMVRKKHAILRSFASRARSMAQDDENGILILSERRDDGANRVDRGVCRETVSYACVSVSSVF